MSTLLWPSPTFGVPGWAITLLVLVILAFGVWLIFDGTKADAEDEALWTHEFIEDGQGWCAQWVEGRSGIKEGQQRCHLTRDEHEEVYGC